VSRDPTGYRRTGIVFWALGGLLLIFLVLPLIVTIVNGGWSGLAEVAQEWGVLRSIGITFLAAFIATAIAFVLGTPLAYLLSRKGFFGKSVVQGLVDVPLVIPHTAAGIALLMVFGAQGVIGEPFASVGVFFTENLAGIVIAMLFVSVPLFVGSAQAAFGLVDARLEHVARTLGASPWRSFFGVALPLAGRGLLAGAVLMWARGISEFGAIVILAYNPKTISILTYELYSGYGLSVALPVTALLILIALVILVVFRLVLPSRASGGRWRRD
jgi:molybdate/tungstate transport system permease protein